MSDLDSRAMTQALYRVISQPAAERNWDTVRDFYHPRATLTRTNAAVKSMPSGLCMTLDEYIDNVERNLSGAIFSEIETGHHCERFGSVAQVRSTYETVYKAGDTEIRARGVNFLILAFLEGRWQIIAIAWDNERAGLTLPDEWTTGA